MKITDIKQQVKRTDRYSIFVDGKYSFALSEGELLRQALKIGKELDEQNLSDIKDDATIDRGVYKAMDLIARRPRSRWELEDYLKRKSYKPEEVQKMIKILEDRGCINDLDFAKRWVENRRLLKPTSKRKLRLELRQKRIKDDLIDQALSGDDTDDQIVLIELISRKRRQSRYADDQKLIAYLARQGFSYEDIKNALNGKVEE